MPPTTAYSFGDIVLVPFPFTDQTGTKKRPAVVISSAAYNAVRRDVVIMAVTSQARPAGAIGEIEVRDWKGAGLIKLNEQRPRLRALGKRCTEFYSLRPQWHYLELRESGTPAFRALDARGAPERAQGM